jgi:HSP20 family protein
MAERRDIERLHDELEQLFEDLWRVPRFGRPRRAFRPDVDVLRTEDPDELRVVVDLAGVDPDQVHVLLVDSTLVVAGTRPAPQPGCAGSYYHLEIERGPFQRRIALPEGVNAKQAAATYERGLLTIVLPLTAKAAVPVKASIPVTRS